jgi:hypothetical protein
LSTPSLVTSFGRGSASVDVVLANLEYLGYI